MPDRSRSNECITSAQSSSSLVSSLGVIPRHSLTGHRPVMIMTSERNFEFCSDPFGNIVRLWSLDIP